MTLDNLNAITFVLGVVGFTLIVARLGDRLHRYILFRGWRAVPILLWRDLLLFAAFLLIFGGNLVARLFDLNLRDNVPWVVVTDILGLGAIAFWVYVEYFVVEDPKR